MGLNHGMNITAQLSQIQAHVTINRIAIIIIIIILDNVIATIPINVIAMIPIDRISYDYYL